MNRFTSEEIIVLRNSYSHVSHKQIDTLLPKHSLDSIRYKARELGLTRTPLPRWTSDEIKTLKNCYKLPRNRLKQLLPKRSWRAIYLKMLKLGLWRPEFRFKQTNFKKLNDFEKGWLSGLMDGEGSIMLHQGRDSIIPKVCISNTNKNLLRRIRNVVKMGKLRFWSNPQGKDVGEWYIQAINEILSFLKQLKEQLIVKRRQAEVMIEFCESRLKNGSYTERDYEIVKLLKKLNQKGRHEPA